MEYMDLNRTNTSISKTVENNETTPTEVVIICSLIFIVIGVIGIGGNLLVIISVMCNKKMRTSMTNLLITNLAVADLMIMVFGIPEIIEFMKKNGWTLNLLTCKINRYILVSALYGSILTLLALSVERYIAIIHPIKAHILCNKRRLVVVLGCIWPFAWIAGLPTLLFNTLDHSGPDRRLQYCMIQFPGDHMHVFLAFKYAESLLFYYMPLVLQISLYFRISRHLFIGTDRLYRIVHTRDLNGMPAERFSEALQARRGVVKMLILSVFVYLFSYSPHQFLLIWNTFAPKTFHENWTYLVFTMIIAYVNSAANPILYSIFSQNFRQCYKQFAFCAIGMRKPENKARSRPPSTNVHGSPKLWRHMSTATASTNV
ncbi:neuropeptide receptor 15-like [Mercenaria mercenaria]|uniref:neuropeptide receptor 15-like n=1 Tax=Mercenaria mercenaria TaxID=6596 RepID=UPI00234EC1A1|nr:neuropeptide receptor 15-like [Mercenaria mercenaria]